MRKDSRGVLIYSPSDLVLFMRSPFASWLERKLIEDPDSLPGNTDEDPMNALLGEKGDAHEAAYLLHLEETLGPDRVATIDPNYSTAANNTRAAMEAGYDVIFQAYLDREGLRGFADFLVKVPGASRLGDYHYEVWDTKLSKSTRPYFVTQLCCYSWMLEELQDRLPDEIVVVLGDRTKDRIRVAAHMAHFVQLKDRFLKTQDSFTSEFSDMPDPTFLTDYGRWGGYARAWMEQTDSLSIVANIRKTQILKLYAAGIYTLKALAETTRDGIKGMQAEIFLKLKEQASIQYRSRGLEKPLFEVLSTTDGKGLEALPPKSPLDVYFDIEGHPLMDGGLEYLWGVSISDESAPKGKSYGFLDWWAHDRQQEKAAFEAFIDWVYARWIEDPSMHIYHYATYEITAIKKISQREQTRLDQVAELLAQGVFVDLYRIVLNGLRIGEPKYSIKSVEHLYRDRRLTEVANGGESVVVYERWRETGGEGLWKNSAHGLIAWRADPTGFNWDVWSELKAIRDYNIDDCESTLELVHWLRKLQNENQITYAPFGNELLIEVERTERQEANAERRSALQERQQRLIQQQAQDLRLNEDPDAVFLVSLLQFYARERKPKAFEYLQRLQKTTEELIDDDAVLHGLKITERRMVDDKLQCYGVFSLDQLLRKDRFKRAVIFNTNVSVNHLAFTDIDDHNGAIVFSLDPLFEAALNQEVLILLGTEDFINTEALEVGLCDLVESYFATGALPAHLASLIHRDTPNLEPGALPVTRQAYPDDKDYMAAIIRAVHSMQETVLCLQGPPGSGKTYTAQKVIESLVNNGRRVGVMSNSHAAIMNLLEPVAKMLPNYLVAKIGGFESDKAFREKFSAAEYSGFRYRSGMSFTRAEPFPSFSVIGATAFGFAKLDEHSPLDYLFVDEASQVSMANLIVAAGSARNLILMGDQMQLEQPIQGVHPGNAGQSALEYLLADEAVISEDKGIFLERTYRMHPAICYPVSELVYEGKLGADAANHFQSVVTRRGGAVMKSAGIQTLWVDHEGNTQSSKEEADVIIELIHDLEGATVTRKDRTTKIIDHEDILVIAPYNMQVNLLKDHLPDTVRVGTIDKFQGQEASVVIVSMTVSEVEESPRGLDFVFDKNRLNVAISRAKALVLLVASPRLVYASVNSIAQMERVGAFLRFTQEGSSMGPPHASE